MKIKLEVENNKPFYVIDNEVCPIEQLDIEVAQRLILDPGEMVYFIYDFNKQRYETLVNCVKDEITLEYYYTGVFWVANDLSSGSTATPLRWTATPALGLD